MWIRDVDLPEALITAQSDGRLVIFAGAGVSMGAPSDLPSFNALVRSVAAGTLVQNHAEALDAFLGRLETRGVDVQARTRAIVDNPASRPKPLHERIVRLFRDETTVRLVTTNFDRHFSTVSQEVYPNIEIFTGPALPLGRDVRGLVYLHGAVEKPQSRLVLTDGDFGRAYLADGWATRFLMEMFRDFTVLFIGYSHQDPVMRYVARSFMGPTARFALVPAGNDDDFWLTLGTTPVHFSLRPPPDDYAALDEALQGWSSEAAMGILDQETRIAQSVEIPPSPDPETADYLRRVLRSAVTLRFFVDRARTVEWFQWVEAEGFFAPVVSTAPLTTAEGRLLAGWVAQFAVQHPQHGLGFVRRHAATLNPLVCDLIVFRLVNPEPPLSADTLRIWAAALLTIPTTPVVSLNRLLRACAEAGDVATTWLLFRTLVRPQLQFENSWRGDGELPLRLSVEMSLRGDEHDLRDVWESTILPNLPTLYRELLPTISAYLTEASSLLVAAARADEHWDPMSFRRVAIEPHGQDHIAKDWGLLIDAARELIDWLLVHDAALARVTIDTWGTAPQPLLVRLAIYGIGRRRDLAPDDALLLVEQNRWLYKLSYKHEVFDLLSRVFSRAGEHAQRRFIQYSITPEAVITETLETNPPTTQTRDYEQYNVAVWLRQVAPDSDTAVSHLEALQQQHPNFAPRDHPDMDRWISASFVGPISPKTAEELIAMAPAVVAPYLATYEPPVVTFRGPDRDGLLRALEQAAVADIDWSLGVADALVVNRTWTSDVWGALLGAWRTATVDSATWQRIIALLDTHPEITAAAPPATALCVERDSERRDLPMDDVERIERMGERLLGMTDTQPPGVTDGDGTVDWEMSAINHPGGKIAESWLNAVARRITIAGDDWRGLPEAVQDRIEALLRGDGNNAAMARTIFASHLPFLFRADRTWTEAHVVPQFDWNADTVRAAQAWQGFLTRGKWSDPLVERMGPFIRQTFTRTAALGDKRRAFLSGLASVAAFSTADPWHSEGWLFEFVLAAPVDDRAMWADEFGRHIESLSPAGVEALWARWISDYWQERITGVPRQLEDHERQAMVTWLPSLRPRLSSAIDRILAAPPSTLNGFVFYRLHESGIGATEGAEIGRFLRQLLPRLTAVAHDHGEVVQVANEAADHGADRADLVGIAAEMTRLGCRGAAELRDRARSSTL